MWGGVRWGLAGRGWVSWVWRWGKARGVVRGRVGSTRSGRWLVQNGYSPQLQHPGDLSELKTFQRPLRSVEGEGQVP